MTTTNSTTDYYELLGVKPDATFDEIRTAYRAKVRLCHPDLVANKGRAVRNGATEVTTLLNEAYECLSDPDRRITYDGRRTDAISAATRLAEGREGNTTVPPRPQPTSRRTEHRTRDLFTASLGGILLPLVVLAWTLSQYPVPMPVHPAWVVFFCTGVIAATIWVLTSSQLLRRPERLSTFGRTWARLMSWAGWSVVGSCAVVLAIPVVAGLFTVTALIASPVLGLVMIAVISARFDNKRSK